MTDAFHSHLRKSLDDENLQIALDGNSERRLSGKRAAFASLTDPEDMRQKAHTIRADVIDHLDHYLEQFIASAQANGIITHRAADAHQAVQIVLDICQNQASGSASPLLVAKSKSMVSEEIHLNHALEEAGIRVVETDLGEYIIQLRGEPPAHIITPAVHLRRQQVGQLFHEKLGVPYTENIPEMTNTARRTLREVFLNADIGISGVNFGVAESGTLVLVTNEGNGRMVTTLPKVHIALMGMERLVPTLDDLAVMLALLPRSATGQKLSVYTSLLHGPRRAGDSEGPQERHLVIVDNGRSAIRQSPLVEALYCIRCGACLNACPVFRELGGHAYVSIHGRTAAYPGPIGSVLSPALFGAAEFGQLARASSLCGACKENCPVDIDLPKLLLRIRAGVVAPAGRVALDQPASPVAVPGYLAWGLRLFSWVASRPRLYGLAQRLAGIGSHAIAPFSEWLHFPAFTGWGYSKDFPRPATTSFREQWKRKKMGDGASGNREIPALPRPSSPTPDLPVSQSFVSLTERFATELITLSGEVIFCRSDDLATEVVTFLRMNQVKAIQAWDGAYLPTGLIEILRTEEIEVSQTPDPAIRVGLTGAAAGIAETGTLFIPGSAGQPLTASLLPETHLAVLRASDIRANLAQVLKLDEVRKASAAALVTGPSRTGDIEMSLTIGVHGPGRVVVFCLQDA